MTDIILVQPKIEIFDQVLSNPVPPVSLLSICSEVKNDYSIKLIDTRIDKKWKLNLLKELNKNPLCVATTSITGLQIKYALEISKFVKENSKIPVVWGGRHTSNLPRETLKNEYVDFVVKGPGIRAFKQLVDSLKKQQITTKKIKRIFEGNPKDFSLDIDYSLVDIRNYFMNRFKKKTLMITTTSGCPKSCSFCSNSKSKWNSFSERKSIELIDYFHDKYGVKHFWFMEDNSFINWKRTFLIAEHLKEKDLSWEAATDIDILTSYSDNQLKFLEDSGCKLLTPGIESGSQRVLDTIGKQLSIKQVININKKLAKYNIIQYYSFMCGFPNETILDVKKTIRLIFKLMKDNQHAQFSSINPFIPFPGTYFYNYLKLCGENLPIQLEDWALMNQNQIYDSPYSNWLSTQKKNYLIKIFLLSNFLDNKDDYVDSYLIRLASKLYSRFAEMRLKNLYFDWMFEKKIFQEARKVMFN